MCLDTITNDQPQETDWFTAYKVMTIQLNPNYKDHVSGQYMGRYEFDKEYTATYHSYYNTCEQKKIYIVPTLNSLLNEPAAPFKYDPGFHCLKTKEDAQTWLKQTEERLHPYIVQRRFFKVVEVKVKNILAEGIQKELPVIVTQYMIIPQNES